MQRITISVDDELAADFERLLEKRRYRNRSEAFRDLVRGELSRESLESGLGNCVGVVSYTYDHHARTLSKRMVEHQHDHASLVVSSMHVHLDHDRCVEAVVMRGATRQVRHLAESIVAETGIENGTIHLIPIEGAEKPHHGHSCHE